MLLGSLLNHLAVKLSDIFNTRFKRGEKNYFRRKVKSDFIIFKQTSYHLFIWVTLAELLMQLYKWKRNKRGPMFRN